MTRSVVDLDDALMHPGAVSKFVAASRLGHDVIVATMFRPDAPTREYRPDFVGPRGKYGGDVWIHPRAYRRGLFRMLPDDLLKDGGTWLRECTDYATMVPMVELAQSPIFIPEYLYWHERHTVLDGDGARLRDELVQRILARRVPENILDAARSRRGSTPEAS